MLLIFPEANHNLQRRVRPLSKGFTRIIDSAFDKNFELLLYLIPVGQNYKKANQIGDAAALHFGKPIVVQSGQYFNETNKFKEDVAVALKKLTTHIEDETSYDRIVEELEANGADFLNPTEVNAQILKLKGAKGEKTRSKYNLIKTLFVLLNLPIIFIWRTFIKPKVPELEFMSTFRFVFSMLVYPVFYTLLILILTYTYNIKTGCIYALTHLLLNIIFIKTDFSKNE
jgi:hypothetical protein